MREFNKYQTALTPELIKDLPKEVYLELLEYIESVPFIRNLIAHEDVRGYAKDRPKYSSLDDEDEDKLYEDDRIIVDITKPHILENMDYFRERALFFDKYGKYTDLTPNPNPNSEYGLFWKNEVYKWKYGVVRPSDGEWIPGGLYFYWNYSPIWQVIETTVNVKRRTKTRGERIRKFPKPWLGDYLFYHYVEQGRERGMHGKMLKARGIGASMKLASMSPRNMFVYPGSGNPNFHLASDKSFLSGDKGIYGKVVDVLDWIAEHTPLPKIRATNSIKSMEIQLGYQNEYGGREGLLSSVYGVSMKDNPDKARGIRGPLIHYEEDGVFPNLKSIWSINRKAVEDGDVAFGYMIALGTGGSKGADFTGSEELFYNPNANNIYGIHNVFDKNADVKSTCGFFWGSYLNRNKCYCETTGEPDVIKALIDILKDWHVVKYNATDTSTITQKKAEECITPQDAIMRVDGTIFPVSDLRNHLENIAPNRTKMESNHYIGILELKDGTVAWKASDAQPIRKFPYTENNLDGALVIFEMPKKNSLRGRYIGGADPIDDDSGTSLASIIFIDSYTKRIVAEYTGRPKFADDYYEICRRLAIFYNGEICYENNKKGLFTYFDNRHSSYLLCDTPQILSDTVLVKGELYGNKRKGVNATKEINSFARKLIKKWLLSEAYSEVFEEGNYKFNYTSIESIPLLEELIQWNPDGNFDRVSALGMVMILLEDRLKYIECNMSEKQENNKFLDSEFFKRKNTKFIKNNIRIF